MPKYLTIVKGSENHAPPPPALLEGIDQLMKDAGKRLVGVGGLLPSGKGARARLAKGKVAVTDGPFTEAKEVIGGWAIMRGETKADVLRASTEFLELHRKYWPDFECECEVRLIEAGFAI